MCQKNKFPLHCSKAEYTQLEGDSLKLSEENYYKKTFLPGTKAVHQPRFQQHHLYINVISEFTHSRPKFIATQLTTSQSLCC